MCIGIRGCFSTLQWGFEFFCVSFSLQQGQSKGQYVTLLFPSLIMTPTFYHHAGRETTGLPTLLLSKTEIRDIFLGSLFNATRAGRRGHHGSDRHCRRWLRRAWSSDNRSRRLCWHWSLYYWSYYWGRFWSALWRSGHWSRYYYSRYWSVLWS
jgi:hypothetical protein